MVSVAFGPFRLDPVARRLTRDGTAVPLGGRAFDTLAALAATPGETVSKDALLDAVWPGVTVEENNLQVQISTLRKLLGDGWIVTVPGRGYRLASPSAAPPPPAQPSRPSLAVLPFANLSGDPEQEYFADGVVEDIITALSRVGGLFVIARNSSFSYKGTAPDSRKVGRELGVRYVLDGSLRRASGQVRITAQLIEAATGGLVWADRFEGALDDIFALQDQITASVVGAIEPSLRTAEFARAWAKPTENLSAYDLCLRGLHQQYLVTRGALDAAVGFFRQAIDIDPDYALAKAYLASTYGLRQTAGWSEPGDQQNAIALAEAAIEAANDDPVTLRAAGWALGYAADKSLDAAGGHFATALAALNRALRLHPNSAQVLLTLGWMQLWAGLPARSIAYFENAIRISPRDQEMGYLLHGLGTAHLMLGRDEDALVVGQRGIDEMPRHGSIHRVVIVALVRLGRTAAARAALLRLLQIVPDTTLAKVSPPSAIPGFAEGMIADLRRAGYPE